MKSDNEEKNKAKILGFAAFVGPMVGFALGVMVTETIYTDTSTLKRIPGTLKSYIEVEKKWNPTK